MIHGKLIGNIRRQNNIIKDDRQCIVHVVCYHRKCNFFSLYIYNVLLSYIMIFSDYWQQMNTM